MGGKKRKKGVSTDTSGTDLDSSDTAVKRQDSDMEVSGAVLDRLKVIEEKLEDNKSVLSAKIVEEIDKLRSEIFDLKKENDHLNKRLQKSEQTCVGLRGDIEQLQHGVTAEREKRNELDQYGRREMLRVVNLGPDNGSRERDAECEDMVLQMIHGNLGLQHISRQHISVAHRVGKFNKGYRRQVIVRFVSRRHRNEVLRARRKLKGTGIGIVEDLTALNRERLTKASRHKGVRNTWTREGRVFALLDNDRIVEVERGDLSVINRDLQLGRPPPGRRGGDDDRPPPGRRGGDDDRPPPGRRGGDDDRAPCDVPLSHPTSSTPVHPILDSQFRIFLRQ